MDAAGPVGHLRDPGARQGLYHPPRRRAPRDLRILGPVFSHSSSILAREKAMVINLEFIRVIVTAEEVLLLDPLAHEVLPFVDQLRQHLL